MREEDVQKHIDEFQENMNLDELSLQYPIDLMLGFNKDNIEEKIRECAGQIAKFKMLHLKEYIKLQELQNILDRTICEQYDWYKFEHDRTLTKSEIESYYIPKDVKVTKLKRIVTKQNIRTDFFGICVDGFKHQLEMMHDYISLLNNGEEK